MKVTLPYGETTLEATLPDRTRVLATAETATLPPAADLATTVREALARPRGLPPIRELVRPGARVLIAFDDVAAPDAGRRQLVEHGFDGDAADGARTWPPGSESA